MEIEKNGKTTRDVIIKSGNGTGLTVSATISNLGHVTLHVASQGRRKVNRRIFNVVEIDIPKIHLRSKFGVKEYPKPVGLANKYGFGAPILWPKKHEAPAVVLAAIKIALPELKTEFNEKQIAALDSAVEKLGSLPDFSDITASENTILSFADGNFALTT